MNATLPVPDMREIPVLLRGDVESISGWLRQWEIGRVLVYLAVIFAGAGLYGAAMGYWRAPLQALYAAVKFPLVILLTTLGNAMLNAMLAPLLGLHLGFRQSMLAILMSFTIGGAVLGSFSPLMFFMIANTPPMSSPMAASTLAYNFVQLTQVAIIAFAGVVANLRLLQLLERLSGNAAVARRVLFAWLAGNLFLGSQLCWVFRPLIGSPALEVEFLRSDAWRGSFYETVFRAAEHLFLH